MKAAGRLSRPAWVPPGGLQPSTTYTYYVIAYDAAGNSSVPSNTVSVTTRKAKGGGKRR